MSVTAVAAATGVTVATACHHLKLLVASGLAVRKRKGRESIYRWSDRRCYIRFESVPPAPESSSSATSG